MIFAFSLGLTSAVWRLGARHGLVMDGRQCWYTREDGCE